MLKFEPIQKHHQRDVFDCGEPALNEFLKKFARQNDENNVAKTFVAVDTDKNVLGYYSVSAASIEFTDLPGDISERLPRYPIPAARIGRLAVDQSVQGSGIGSRLLIDALKRIYLSSDQVAIKVVLVDALNEKAQSFYEHFGFIRLSGEQFKLFLPIETVSVLFR
jgi:ribosomal protein S18 acetylase RimI-like enzyme